MSQIICKNVSLGYEGHIVTKNINFEVNKGDYICIVGENGSGKSTLVKALLGLLKSFSGSIDKGSIRIGYLPQQTEIQSDFPASVREVVVSGCSGSTGGFFYGKKERNIALNCMKKMRIDNLATKSFRELSGGQKQRVLLARALCAADDILLLDEPVTGLDPAVTTELYKILKKLNHDDDMTIIMVSHDINSALKYATKILHIGHSQLFFGDSSEYLKSDAAKLFSRSGGKKNE